MSAMDAYKAELAEFLKGFARNVRRLRAAKEPGFSQEKLSDATSLHRTEIGRIEQASVEPRLTTLVILADGLGVKLDELVDGLPVPVERKPSPRSRAGLAEELSRTRPPRSERGRTDRS
jgi:transcriptional regulator with XRE-family HTH domain